MQLAKRDDDAAGPMRSADPALRAAPLRGRERMQRASLLTAIVTVHLLLLLWLVTSPTTPIVPRDAGRNLVLISISTGQSVATPPTVPKPPPPIVLPPPAIIVPSLRALPAAAQNPSPSGAGAPLAGDLGGCALADRTAEAIVGDPGAMAELAALPPAYRTSADAVMLWNGEWLASAPGSIAPPPTPSLHRVVEQVIAEASPECRDAPMGGPQFLAIPEQDRTTTLVIGSGAWRWSDLLANSTACLGSGSDACLPTTANPLSTNYLNVKP